MAMCDPSEDKHELTGLLQVAAAAAIVAFAAVACISEGVNPPLLALTCEEIRFSRGPVYDGGQLQAVKAGDRIRCRAYVDNVRGVPLDASLEITQGASFIRAVGDTNLSFDQTNVSGVTVDNSVCDQLEAGSVFVPRWECSRVCCQMEGRPPAFEDGATCPAEARQRKLNACRLQPFGCCVLRDEKRRPPPGTLHNPAGAYIQATAVQCGLAGGEAWYRSRCGCCRYRSAGYEYGATFDTLYGGAPLCPGQDLPFASCWPEAALWEEYEDPVGFCTGSGPLRLDNRTECDGISESFREGSLDDQRLVCCQRPSGVTSAVAAPPRELTTRDRVSQFVYYDIVGAGRVSIRLRQRQAVVIAFNEAKEGSSEVVLDTTGELPTVEPIVPPLPDAGVERPDAGPDAMADALPRPDARPEAGPDAQPDAGPDASVPDAQPDAGGSCVTFSDGNFTLTDWDSRVAREYGGPNQTTVERRPSRGNPGAYHYTQIRHPSQIASGLWMTYLRTSATYDPSVEGAITSLSASVDIDWAETSPETPNRAAIGSLAIVQDDTVYWNSSLFVFSGEGWKTHTASTLAEFERLSDVGPMQPDFTTAGSEMQFGFVVAGSATAGVGTPAFRFIGIDNWSFTVCR